MKTITQNEVLSELNDGLIKQSKCVMVIYSENQVNYGFDDKPNFEYCKQHNISCIDIGRRGGVFVVNRGDIGFGYITKGLNNSIGIALFDHFLKYLIDLGLNAQGTGNDILINGYKVFGWASNYYKDYDAIYVTAHFTLSVDLNLIKNICMKPMIKIPKGLTEFGISAEDLKTFIFNFISNYK